MTALKVPNPDSVRVNEQGNGVCFGIGGDGRRVFFAGPWSPPYGGPVAHSFFDPHKNKKSKNPIAKHNKTKTRPI